MSNNIAMETPLMHAHGNFSHHEYSAGGEIAFGELLFDLVVKEMPLCSHLNIRGDAGDDAFCAGIQQVLGIALPTQPGHYHTSRTHSLYWLGPDEWLLVSQAESIDLQAQLRAALSGHLSIVDVAGGQTIINLRGSAVALDTLLKKSSVYDSVDGALRSRAAGAACKPPLPRPQRWLPIALTALMSLSLGAPSPTILLAGYSMQEANLVAA